MTKATGKETLESTARLITSIISKKLGHTMTYQVVDDPIKMTRRRRKLLNFNMQKIFWKATVQRKANTHGRWMKKHFSKIDIYANHIVFLPHPTKIKDASGRIHNESGPAVYWTQTKQYYLRGVDVTSIWPLIEAKKVSPRTIFSTSNAEVRAILMEMVGVKSLMEHPDAKILDSRENLIENSEEVLVQYKAVPNGWEGLGTRNIHVLFCTCPSTNKTFGMIVPNRAITCEQAQKELWGSLPNPIVGRS